MLNQWDRSWLSYKKAVCTVFPKAGFGGPLELDTTDEVLIRFDISNDAEVGSLWDVILRVQRGAGGCCDVGIRVPAGVPACSSKSWVEHTASDLRSALIYARLKLARANG